MPTLQGPGAVVVLSLWVDPGAYSEDVNSTTGFKEFGHIDIMGKGTQMLQLGSLAFSTVRVPMACTVGKLSVGT
jgi:hypothetical protein